MQIILIKKVIFKNCAPFTNCISEISNIQVDNAKDLDIVMPIYNLIEYTNNYSKTPGNLSRYCKDIHAVDNNNAIVDFTENNLTDLFNFKVKMTGQTGTDGTKSVEIIVFLSYLGVFWRSFKLPLINCEVNLILTPSTNCVIFCTNVANQNATFETTDTNLYVLVVTLSTQGNAKLLQQLKYGFKTVVNWNKYLSKQELFTRNPNLNRLVEPSFQLVNRPFVLTFENDEQRISHSGYYIPNVEIKNYNVMIIGENFFEQPIKSNKVTYENIGKIVTGQGDDCLLDNSYFNDTYKTILGNLSKQLALDADPRAIQQINFTANLDRACNTRIYFILEEAKESILNFAQGTVKVL